MKKLKVMTILGTRPEIIRLSCVIKSFDENFDHILVHTGQNYDYELNEVFFKDLSLRKPDEFLNSVGLTTAETIGNIISKVDSVIEKYKPDAVLVLGDTNSCLSSISCKRRKVPVFHMEAGNRCFDQRVPEEINRKIVDHIADINLTYSDISREYLLAEGFPADRIIKTGSPMFEVLHTNMEKIRASKVLGELGLETKKYFLVSAHREENIDSARNFEQLFSSLNAVAELYRLPVIISTHPRTQKRLSDSGISLSPFVKTLKPLGFFDYVMLQMSAKVVLSDSGTISEESSILSFPALNIRDAHERPEGMEEAAAILTGVGVDRILQGINILENQQSKNKNFRLVADYAMPNVADKMVRIILSYTDYVNRKVWHKN